MQTPPPDINKIVDLAGGIGGRVSAGLEGVLEICGKYLPPLIRAFNNKRNLDLPLPVSYHIAGEKIGERGPNIVIGCSTQLVSMSPTMYAAQNSIVLYATWNVFDTRSQILNSIDYAQIMMELFGHYQQGYRDALDRKLWTSMTIQNISPLPSGKMGEYKGYAANMIMFQAPDCDGWGIAPIPPPVV